MGQVIHLRDSLNIKPNIKPDTDCHQKLIVYLGPIGFHRFTLLLPDPCLNDKKASAFSAGQERLTGSTYRQSSSKQKQAHPRVLNGRRNEKQRSSSRSLYSWADVCVISDRSVQIALTDFSILAYPDTISCRQAYMTDQSCLVVK
jgi:hypothetical protein